MENKVVTTGWAKIYIAGPIAVAEQVCREECMREGLCVTIEPTKFIYTGGEETGVVVGFVNYPRFPSEQAAITKRASDLALLLIERLCQTSAMVMDPAQTVWFSRRGDTAAPPKKPQPNCAKCFGAGYGRHDYDAAPTHVGEKCDCWA